MPIRIRPRSRRSKKSRSCSRPAILTRSVSILDPADGYLWPAPDPPPEDEETLLELLERELGGHPHSRRRVTTARQPATHLSATLRSCGRWCRERPPSNGRAFAFSGPYELPAPEGGS